MKMRAELLHRIPLFSSLPADELTRIEHALKEGRYDAGDVLFVEGDTGDRLCIISEGQIDVVKALGSPDEHVIAIRGPGDYVGEMSLIQVDGKRTASIRARTPLRTLEMTRTEFDALLHRQPQIAYQMARVLSSHLNEAHAAAIAEMRKKNRELSTAYESLQAAQAQLIQKERLEHELRMARSVQAGLLPRNVPAFTGWQFASRWHPARQVSGDFYDFIPLSNSEMGVVIADVSDKGMPAALFMTLSRSILRASITALPELSDAVTRANRLICADAADNMFVTVFACTLHPHSGALKSVNAGHNPPLLFESANQHWHELDVGGLVLGVMEDVPFVQREITLEAGDTLVIYTDGVTDALNVAEERFGMQRLMDVLQSAQGESAGGIAHAIEASLANFTAGHEPFDDMTYVVIKRV
jgi:serine phosphatase RsbU (regulator of sigma subunit)